VFDQVVAQKVKEAQITEQDSLLLVHIYDISTISQCEFHFLSCCFLIKFSVECTCLLFILLNSWLFSVISPSKESFVKLFCSYLKLLFG